VTEAQKEGKEEAADLEGSEGAGLLPVQETDFSISLRHFQEIGSEMTLTVE